MRASLKAVEGKMLVSILQIPEISLEDVEGTDLRVAHGGGGPIRQQRWGTWWYSVIYRPRSNELFRVRCSRDERYTNVPPIMEGTVPNCQLEVETHWRWLH